MELDLSSLLHFFGMSPCSVKELLLINYNCNLIFCHIILFFLHRILRQIKCLKLYFLIGTIETYSLSIEKISENKISKLYFSHFFRNKIFLCVHEIYFSDLSSVNGKWIHLMMSSSRSSRFWGREGDREDQDQEVIDKTVTITRITKRQW